ncbi:MAG: tetratricopeptide repeat protein [Bacteroidia bacterium]|nr:tetratricopeptide repeat protein [Bacteroidia bacterium]
MGANDSLVAQKYYKKATQYYRENFLDSSVFYYRKAQVHYGNVGDLTNKNRCYIDISYNYILKGDYGNAEKILSDGLNQCIEELGSNNAQTASIYGTLGILYNKKGDYYESIAYFKKSLEIKKSVYGEEHISTAQSYNNLAITYWNIKDVNQSLGYHQKALEIKKKFWIQIMLVWQFPIITWVIFIITIKNTKRQRNSIKNHLK